MLDRSERIGLEDEFVEVLGAPADFGSRFYRVGVDIAKRKTKEPLTTKDVFVITMNRLAPSQIKGMLRTMTDNVVLDSRNRPLIGPEDVNKFPKEFRPLALEYLREANRIQNDMDMGDSMVSAMGMIPKKFSVMHDLNNLIAAEKTLITNERAKLRNMFVKGFVDGDREMVEQGFLTARQLGLEGYIMDKRTQTAIVDAAIDQMGAQIRTKEASQRILPE